MRIGCCLPFKDEINIFKAKILGYDYIETALNSFDSAAEEEIAAFVYTLNEAGISCPVMNCMFTGQARLTGNDADHIYAKEYLYRMFEAIEPIKIKKIVFGSGGARRVPDDFPKEKAFEQLIKFCSDCIAPVMEKYNAVCCVEELNSLECNILNTAEEVMDLIHNVNKPQIKLLVDYYHMCMENESVERLLKYKTYISHVHIASAKNKRDYPKSGDGEDYKAFFDILERSDYESKLITIEGRAGLGFIDSSVEALKCLKNL